MHIISSKTDIETYLANAGVADPMNPSHRDAVVAAIQSDDHPPYGRDWSEWFEANLDRISTDVAR